MKKRRIVLASILKPVDDTRMFEKMAVSLARVNEYEIFVIGFPTKEPKVISQNITQIPLKKFNRLSIGRLLAPLKVLNYIYKVKPEVLMVNTHELLLVSCVNRIFFYTSQILICKFLVSAFCKYDSHLCLTIYCENIATFLQ